MRWRVSRRWTACWPACRSPTLWHRLGPEAVWTDAGRDDRDRAGGDHGGGGPAHLDPSGSLVARSTEPYPPCSPLALAITS